MPRAPGTLPDVNPRLTALLAAAVLMLAGCSNATPKHTAPPASSSTSASAAPPSPAAPRVDAKAVLAQLAVAGLPMTGGVVQDENTDPNNLLGRPNGYLSRASFDVPGGDPDGDKFGIDRGGVIEVWPDAAGAQTRSAFIQKTLKDTPILGTEYHYLNGPVLVRISGKVKPSVAAKFEAAVAALKV